MNIIIACIDTNSSLTYNGHEINKNIISWLMSKHYILTLNKAFSLNRFHVLTAYPEEVRRVYKSL